MTWKRIRDHLRKGTAAVLAVFVLSAAEHKGEVKFGGLPIPGATVTATQGGKKFAAVTDQQGFYSFRDLPDGAWTIHVDMLCFSAVERQVTVAPGAPASEWELKLLPFDEIKAAAGPASAAAPAAEQLIAAPVSAAPPAKSDKKARARRGSAPPQSAQGGFQRTDVNASPSNAMGDPGKPGDEGGAASGDLAQSASNAFSINGSVNNGAASPFSQSQAFGNNRRPGRSLYNGSVAFILDNSVLDARSFSLTGQDTPKPAHNHPVRVASFGGPLRIPHLIRGNSLNFFVGYQWMRNRNASTGSGLMPVASQREGDLSQLSPFRDPTNGLPFPGNVIPQSRISPQATALLNYYPLPNFTPTARYNYQTPLVGVTDQDSVQSRLSKTLNAKISFGTFAFQRTDSTTPNLFGFHDATGQSGIDTTVNYMRRFNPRIFGTLKFEFSRQSIRLTPNFANRENVSGEAGITGNNQDPLNWGPPGLNFASGIAGLSDAQQSLTRNQTKPVHRTTRTGIETTTTSGSEAISAARSSIICRSRIRAARLLLRARRPGPTSRLSARQPTPALHRVPGTPISISRVRLRCLLHRRLG